MHKLHSMLNLCAHLFLSLLNYAMITTFKQANRRTRAPRHTHIVGLGSAGHSTINKLPHSQTETMNETMCTGESMCVYSANVEKLDFVTCTTSPTLWSSESTETEERTRHSHTTIEMDGRWRREERRTIFIFGFVRKSCWMTKENEQQHRKMFGPECPPIWFMFTKRATAHSEDDFRLRTLSFAECGQPLGGRNNAIRQGKKHC